MFFPLQFSTLNTSHRTPSVYVLILPLPHTILLSHVIFRN